MIWIRPNQNIEKKQEEIAAKTDELIAAQIDENNQYNSMKLRIQYMYENGNGQFLETLLDRCRGIYCVIQFHKFRKRNGR